ncbi:hypothetical protein [Roseibium sediminis]|uniref:hypothetical protein n=1 Tax=Roseibium sediminis TaxID=1775174 RepID=UPI00123CA64A|nr:hypothetical protein [Roseibium sediminis]
MVAFNFMAEFAEPVERGKKRQSIRQTQRCRVGDKIQLYTGQRTKHCRKLSVIDPVCTEVTPIILGNPELTIPIRLGELELSSEQQITAFAKADGFTSYRDMYVFFRLRYRATSFVGFLHKWDWLQPTSVGIDWAIGRDVGAAS